MSSQSDQVETIGLSISAVERDTGISKDTLRVWERRYGYPKPERDQFGERVYRQDQVHKLRTMRRLLDQGHRPGRIIGLPIEELEALGEQSGANELHQVPVDGAEMLTGLLDLIRKHQIYEFRRELTLLIAGRGLQRFVNEIAAPLNALVGHAWSRGNFAIFEEHLYTESLQMVLRNAICTIAPAHDSPRVLLTTFPNEMHSLGLLMAEALLAGEGCRCFSLGTQTPLPDIAQAVTSTKADIVALSFTGSLNPNQVLSGLKDLRDQLPETVEIWCGGACEVLRRRPPAAISVMVTLDQVRPMVERWRATNAV